MTNRSKGPRAPLARASLKDKKGAEIDSLVLDLGAYDAETYEKPVSQIALGFAALRAKHLFIEMSRRVTFRSESAKRAVMVSVSDAADLLAILKNRLKWWQLPRTPSGKALEAIHAPRWDGIREWATQWPAKSRGRKADAPTPIVLPASDVQITLTQEQARSVQAILCWPGTVSLRVELPAVFVVIAALEGAGIEDPWCSLDREPEAGHEGHH